jgi:exopolysaccharide production protein ExoZ
MASDRHPLNRGTGFVGRHDQNTEGFSPFDETSKPSRLLLLEWARMKGIRQRITAKGITVTSPGKLKTIECFRGIAALSVLLFHSEVTVAKAKYFGADPLGGFFIFGANGVDFFFVLSGFIITFAHWADLGRADRVGTYVSKRFARVYPPLWAIAIPFIMVVYASHSEYSPRLPGDKLIVAFSSVTLLPSPLLPLPVVVWTLRHEIFFYAMFCVVLVRPLLGAVLLTIWGSACLLFLLTNPPDNFLFAFLCSPYNLEFLVGILCACIVKTIRIPVPRLILTFGILAFIYAAIASDLAVSTSPHPASLVANPDGNLIALFSIASALLILGASCLDISKALHPPRYLVMMGAASYSIYLVHFPVISATCKLLKMLSADGSIAPLPAFLVVAPVALAAGISFHLLIEKPLTAAVGRRMVARSPIK